MEYPAGVGNLSKVTLELGTGGVVLILMRLGITGGLISQPICGLVGTIPGTLNVFP